MNKVLTIFTPTYNRVYTLNRLYKSLCKQKNKEFIWLIIDDGSTDNTEQLVKKFIGEELIDIKYVYQENSGKMRAHNKAVRTCHTPLFLCVDSDDYLVDECVEQIIHIWEHRILEKTDCMGILAYRGTVDMSNQKYSIKDKIQYSKLNEIYLNGYKGETTLVFKTDLLKKFPFPEIEGEKFITENIVYDLLDEMGVYCLISKVLVISNYYNDGYTMNAIQNLMKNPRGALLFFMQRYKKEKKQISKVKYASNAICYALQSKHNEVVKLDMNIIEKIICFPFGLYLYIKRNKNLKSKREGQV